MKYLKTIVILLGVVLLQNCTLYRIKAVTHPNGATYYFPQKRYMISEWEAVRTYGGGFTLDWAREAIRKDKNPDEVKIKYIK